MAVQGSDREVRTLEWCRDEEVTVVVSNDKVSGVTMGYVAKGWGG